MAGLDQREAAALAKLSLRTLAYAESGRCAQGAWDKLAAMYEGKGLRLVTMPALAGEHIAMIQIAAGVDDISSTLSQPAPMKRARKNAGPTQGKE